MHLEEFLKLLFNLFSRTAGGEGKVIILAVDAEVFSQNVIEFVNKLDYNFNHFRINRLHFFLFLVFFLLFFLSFLEVNIILNIFKLLL